MRIASTSKKKIIEKRARERNGADDEKVKNLNTRPKVNISMNETSRKRAEDIQEEKRTQLTELILFERWQQTAAEKKKPKRIQQC